jgi:hypothetical protein
MLASGLDRYSSHVQIRLRVGTQVLRVAQIGPQRIILRDTADSIPTEATLEIEVDRHTETRSIMLPHGLSKSREEISYF